MRDREIKRIVTHYGYYASDEEAERFLNRLDACDNKLKPCMDEISEEIKLFRSVQKKKQEQYLFLKEQCELYRKKGRNWFSRHARSRR